MQYRVITELTAFNEKGVFVGRAYMDGNGFWQCRGVGRTWLGRDDLSTHCWEQSTAEHWLKTVAGAKTITKVDEV